MPETFDLILKGGEVVNQDGRGLRDLAIRDGKIAGIGLFSADQAAETIDATGLTILPGVIDTQVHFREPGLTHKEDLETGSRAAVMGGVTAVFEMPNTNPLTTSAETLAAKVAAGHHRMHCDFAFFVGGTAENVDDIPELERLPGAAGIKVFIGSSTGNLLVEDDYNLERILKKRHRAARHAGPQAWQARACAAYLDRRRNPLSRASQGCRDRGGDAASPHARGA
jgi:dihydroorotase